MRQGRLLELLTTKAVTCSTPATINQVVIPCTRGLALLLLTICPLAGATTHRVHAGQGSSVIQRVISGASSGDTVSFDAGMYTITSTLTLKCGLTYTGPVATPATAEITTSTANISLTEMTGGCTSGTTTIEYLQFNGAGPLYVDGNSYSNIVFEHNQVTNVPSAQSCGEPCQTLYLTQGNGTTDSNFTIEYNTFGDVNSCTANINVDAGDCGGVRVFSEGPGSSGVSNAVNIVIRYNTFFHNGEGIHFYGTTYGNGTGPTNTCSNCDIEYNYFYQNHRMNVEFQNAGVVGAPNNFSNNVVSDPINPYYWSYAFSLVCCQWTNSFGVQTTQVPSYYANNNVIFDDQGSSGSAIIDAFEMMGSGSQYNNNLIQGAVCQGFVWAHGNNNWEAINNTLQSPLMAAATPCPTYTPAASKYSGAEDGATYSPIFSGNVQGSTPSAVTSVAPTISPSAGAQTFPLTVTLTDPGYTSGVVPLGNTGIWYTTDGSTPVPGSGTARYLASGGTFVLPAPATVKAVGMWGTPNQPTSYPAGYGFVPSAVKSAHYTGGVASQQRRPR